MTCDPQSLVNSAKCLPCIPQDKQMSVLIYIFARMANITTDPAGLISLARCFHCIPQAEQMPVLLYVACQIINSGGGGGPTCLLCGTTNPVGAPVCTCAIYYNTTNASLWYWDNGNVKWQPLIQ